MTSQKISTGGGAGHAVGCTCPFCTSNATTAEVTDVDLAPTRQWDADQWDAEVSGLLSLSHDLRAATFAGADAVDRGLLAERALRDYPEATRIEVTDYDDGNGPDAYVHVYDAKGNEIDDGYISDFRPEGLDDDEPWHIDLTETTRPGTAAAAVREGHRQMVARLAEAYPEWNIPVPPGPDGPDLSKTPGIGKGARVISEIDLRQHLAPGRMMMQRSFNGEEWTGPLSSNVVRIDRVTDRQVVVDYLDSSGKQTTSGGPMRPMIGVSAVDDRGRVYLLDAQDRPFMAYDPMD